MERMRPAAKHRRRCAATATTALLLAFFAQTALAGDARVRGAVGATANSSAAPQVRIVANWVAAAADHGGAPFVIVDKRNATLFVFDETARVVAATPILLGAAIGDASVPGIGERPMAAIKPHERTTPAGRFVGEAGRNLQGEDIVWVDYDAAVSMHRLRANDPRERRRERLATPTAADNRISYGCINVPAAFYDAHVKPVFAGGKRAVVYVMPETRALHDVFPLGPRESPAASVRAGS